MRKAIFAALAGFAAAYFFDPHNGARRRNTTRDRVLAFFRQRGREAGRQARYAEGVAQGMAHKAEAAKAKASGGAERAYDDVTLQSKVESEAFRSPDAPKNRVSVNVEDGVVVLRGQLDSREEIESLVAAVRRVDGVHDVRNLLHEPGVPAPTA